MDKGSSWIGTTVTAALTNANGNVRFGMIFLFCLVSVVGGVFVCFGSAESDGFGFVVGRVQLIVPVPVLIAIPMQKAHDTARQVTYV